MIEISVSDWIYCRCTLVGAINGLFCCPCHAMHKHGICGGKVSVHPSVVKSFWCDKEAEDQLCYALYSSVL